MLLQASVFNFRDYILYLEQIGVYDVFLPFLLVFAIIFAVLEKTKIFGERSNINVVISVIIGLLLVVQQGIVQTINTFLPRVSLIIVVTLMFLLLMSMIVGKEFKGLQGGLLTVALIIVIAALVFALSPSLPTFLTPGERQSLLNVSVPVIALIVAIWLITGFGGKEKKEDGYVVKLAKEPERGFR